MTYKSTNDLPATLRELLPKEAQEIYLQSYNKSWENYDDETAFGDQERAAVAHRDGWAAVNREFVHDEEKGIWYREGEAPKETEEEQGLMEKLKDTLS